MMITKILQRAFLLVLLVVPLSASADDENFSDIFIFGDSLSDNGNLADLLIFLNDPRGIILTTFPFANGFTNDDLTTEDDFAVEVLASGLDLDADPALFLPSFITGMQFVPAGTNYAVAGARANADLTPGDLPQQVTAFLGSSVGGIPSDALYVVFIGGNDVAAAVQSGTVETSTTIIQEAVVGIIDAIDRLSMAGAAFFLIPNIPDLGATPRFRFSGDKEVIKRATRLTRKFNRLLAKAIDEIEDDYDIEVLEFDTFRFLRSTIDNAVSLGFTNVEDPCLSPLVVCDFDSFIFFDDFHPTAKVHGLAGEAMLDQVREDDDDDDDD